MILVHFFGDANESQKKEESKFMTLTITIVVLGIIGTIIFLFGTPEPYGKNLVQARRSGIYYLIIEIDIVSSNRIQVGWTYYFKVPEFYYGIF